MTSDFSLHARVVEPDMLMAATNALAQSHLEIEELEEILGKDDAYVKSLIQLGKQLDLVQETDSKYTINPNVAIEVRQANSQEEKREILKIKLRRYRPFITFTRHLIEGASPSRSALLVKVFYQLGSNEDNIEEQMVKLGEYTGVLSVSGSDVTPRFDTSILSSGYFRGLSGALEDELVARLYLENRLNEDVVAFVDEESFENFVESLQLFGSRPESSISAAARAIETIQRDIGDTYGNGNVDYSGPNGVRELAQALHSDGLTKDRHKLAGELLGEIRNNTGGHGVDSETGKHWSLSEEVAFGYILTGIHYIRSLYHWTVDDQLVV